jgi:crotonobetaine/carnitine-CoA ligase
MCSNRPEFLEVYLGCAWMGAVTVPINTALRGIQLSHILRNATPKLLVIESAFMPAIETLESDVAPPDIIWTIGEDAVVPPSASGSVSPLPPLGEGVSPAPVQPDDTVAILYTSGTTGPSKGVCCPQAQMFWWGVYSALRARDSRGRCAVHDAAAVPHQRAERVLSGAAQRLHLCARAEILRLRFLGAARRHRATVGYLLGAMAVMLLAQPKSADDTAHFLRVALGGGVPGQFHGPFLERFGVPLLDGYGSTETNFVFASSIRPIAPARWVISSRAWRRASSVRTIRLSRREAGELLLRSREPLAFSTGYFGMPDKTAEAWRNLWFHTGDRVVRDADGHYRFVDRMKDSIRRRGENVSSWEVEQVLLKASGNRCLRDLSAAVRTRRRRSRGGRPARTRPCAGADRYRQALRGQDGLFRRSTLCPDRRRNAADRERQDPKGHAARGRKKRPTPGIAMRRDTDCAASGVACFGSSSSQSNPSGLEGCGEANQSPHGVVYLPPKEPPMRVLACTIMTIATALVAAPVRAQTYDPGYPVCLQTYGIDGSYIECSFTSLAQCAASASGRSAQCLINPYFAQGDRKLPRHRGVLLEAAASASCPTLPIPSLLRIIRRNHPFREVM